MHDPLKNRCRVPPTVSHVELGLHFVNNWPQGFHWVNYSTTTIGHIITAEHWFQTEWDTHTISNSRPYWLFFSRKWSANQYLSVFDLLSFLQWALADLGCQMFSMISVPLYDTHGPKECGYIINHGRKAKKWKPTYAAFFLWWIIFFDSTKLSSKSAFAIVTF